MPLALTFALAGAIAGASYLGAGSLLGCVMLTQLVLVAGWYRSVGVPGGVGGAALALASGAVAAVLVSASEPPRLVPVTGLLGAAVLGVLAHQLMRRDRSRVVASMTGTGVPVVLAVLTTLYLPAAGTSSGDAHVGAAVCAAAAARITDIGRWPIVVATGSAAAVGALTGLVIATFTSLGGGTGMLIGFAAGLVAHVSAAVLRQLAEPSSWLAAALPMALVAPLAYVASCSAAGCVPAA